MGAEVEEVTAYQTLQATDNVDTLVDALRANAIDMITFTSSSTVRNFAALLASEKCTEIPNQTAIACIGPITADTAKQLGFRVDIVADAFTIKGLCDAIVSYFTPQSNHA